MKAHLEEPTKKAYKPKRLIIETETQEEEDLLKRIFNQRLNWEHPVKTHKVNIILRRLRETLGE